MNAFNLLQDKIKQYIWNKNWQKFNPIQESAITHITQTSSNFILIAKTASGKTEAAFFPAINMINDWQNGVKILYIAPLIALINDQFIRIEHLCNYLDIKITKWHGEASVSDKNRLLKSPQGILLITPESLEAMFIHKPYQIAHLFNQLEFIIIDEIHNFIGNSRGKHLQCLLDRIKEKVANKTRIIGLSATISEKSYATVKEFLGQKEETKIIIDSDKNKLIVSLCHIPIVNSELPPKLINQIYQQTQNQTSLIFPNSRGRVEEIAVKIKKIAKDQPLYHQNYFSHHSSISKELKEFIEHFAKNSSEKFAISCTSTLELGIDIGSIDTIIQIDSTHSVSSLIQRLGRSGRITKESNLIIYTGNSWSLLQSIACIELYKENKTENLKDISLPYHVLIHQTLSIVQSCNSLTNQELVQSIKRIEIFSQIQDEKIILIINHLLKENVLEQLNHEILIGEKGEKIVHNKNFYALFDTENNFKVYFNSKKIGELPYSPQLTPNENIYLAAFIWRIKEIDLDKKKVYVQPAQSGRKPVFFGTSSIVDSLVRTKMLEIILKDDEYSFPYIDENAKISLKNLKKKINFNNLTDLTITMLGDNQNWYTFASTKVNRTLDLLIKMMGFKDVKYKENETCFSTTKYNMQQIVNKIKKHPLDKQQIVKYLNNNDNWEHLISVYKFSHLLPEGLKIEMFIENYIDINATKIYLQNES